MTERPYILHMFTSERQMSPFDINMAADAGYQIITPYCGVALSDIRGLTQDAIFSRGPKGVARTGIFLGGRDVALAADMLDAAKKAMVPPFQVSALADPSGAYTTAAAMVACVEHHLKKTHNTDFSGKRVLILGGTGTVGRIAGVLACQLGAASVKISSHAGEERARTAAEQVNARFGSTLVGVSGADKAAVRASLADADVVLATAAAGVQVMDADDCAAAANLLVAADVNAVPPEGIAGVGVMDDGKALGGKAVGIGALAVGNVKYQTQQRLLVEMRNAAKPVYLSFAEAFATARAYLADKA